MQNAAGEGISIRCDGRNGDYVASVSALVSLIERAQGSLKRVEAAIGSELPSCGQDLSAKLVVLDDVTPRYSGALAALTASSAGLQRALDYLLDSGTSGPGVDGWTKVSAGRFVQAIASERPINGAPVCPP